MGRKWDTPKPRRSTRDIHAASGEQTDAARGVDYERKGTLGVHVCPGLMREEYGAPKIPGKEKNMGHPKSQVKKMGRKWDTPKPRRSTRDIHAASGEQTDAARGVDYERKGTLGVHVCPGLMREEYGAPKIPGKEKNMGHPKSQVKKMGRKWDTPKPRRSTRDIHAASGEQTDAARGVDYERKGTLGVHVCPGLMREEYGAPKIPGKEKNMGHPKSQVKKMGRKWDTPKPRRSTRDIHAASGEQTDAARGVDYERKGTLGVHVCPGLMREEYGAPKIPGKEDGKKMGHPKT